MKHIMAAMAVLLALNVAAQTQRPAGTFKDTASRRSSVVMKPQNSRDSLKGPVVKPRKWRPRVVITPAPPPGRSRQEIRYSDSLGRVKP